MKTEEQKKLIRKMIDYLYKYASKEQVNKIADYLNIK